MGTSCWTETQSIISLPGHDSDPIKGHPNPQPNTIIIPHQPTTYVMTSPFTMQTFSSETGDDVPLAEFLKTFRQLMTYTHIMGDERIIALFGDHMKYASPAHEWFQALETGMTWSNVETSFLECFPPARM
jgi:hypothetical protein